MIPDPVKVKSNMNSHRLLVHSCRLSFHTLFRSHRWCGTKLLSNAFIDAAICLQYRCLWYWTSCGRLWKMLETSCGVGRHSPLHRYALPLSAFFCHSHFYECWVLILMMKNHESPLPVCWAWLPDRTQAKKGSLATPEPRISSLCLAPFNAAFLLKALLPPSCSLIFSYPQRVCSIVCDHRSSSQLCLRALEEFPRGMTFLKSFFFFTKTHSL